MNMALAASEIQEAQRMHGSQGMEATLRSQDNARIEPIMADNHEPHGDITLTLQAFRFSLAIHFKNCALRKLGSSWMNKIVIL